jgi:hypothetical protein
METRLPFCQRLKPGGAVVEGGTLSEARRRPGSLAAKSRSIAIGALSAHERNSLHSIHGLDDEACARATLAGIGDQFVPENITHWLQKLKPMTKDISVPRHSSGCCNGYWQFDLQFNGLSDFQLDR